MIFILERVRLVSNLSLIFHFFTLKCSVLSIRYIDFEVNRYIGVQAMPTPLKFMFIFFYVFWV